MCFKERAKDRKNAIFLVYLQIISKYSKLNDSKCILNLLYYLRLLFSCFRIVALSHTGVYSFTLHQNQLKK